MAKVPVATKGGGPTPLWIISLFVGLTEAVLGVALIKVEGSIQIALTAFVIVFPSLIATAFFWILWERPYVFYPPNTYDNSDPSQFILTIAAARGGSVATKTADLSGDVKIIGNPDQFVLLFKAAAPKWSKSTKAMDIGTGCIVQVSTEHLASDGAVSVAEAVTFVPGVQISDDGSGRGKRLILSEDMQ